jgi:hypothetical protein
MCKCTIGQSYDNVSMRPSIRAVVLDCVLAHHRTWKYVCEGLEYVSCVSDCVQVSSMGYFVRRKTMRD